MPRIARLLPLVVLVLIALAGRPPDLSAQNTGAPEKLVEFIDDIRLGVRAYGGVTHRNQTVHPMESRNFKYLQQPVNGALSYSTPYVGAAVALRGRGAELAFSIQKDPGSPGGGRRHWLQFEDGSDAIPYSTSSAQFSLRAEYFVFDWVGAGVAYRGGSVSFQSVGSYEVNGKEADPAVTPFSGRYWRETYALYVPMQKEWNGIRFFGRLGASVYGTGTESYDPSFVIHQSPENPSRRTHEGGSLINPEKDIESVNTQFGRVGAAVPVWRTTIRPSVEVERTHVPGMSTTWSYDVQLEVGLPF